MKIPKAPESSVILVQKEIRAKILASRNLSAYNIDDYPQIFAYFKQLNQSLEQQKPSNFS